MGFAFDELSSKVIAAAIDVHRALGPGFLESVYEQALRLELTERGISFEPQKEIRITYAGRTIGTHKLDLLVAGLMVVELKAVERFEDVHFAQVKSYLRASRASLGLLINFSGTKLVVKRVVLGYVDNVIDRRAVS